DMDGTLLNSARKISEENAKAIFAATKAGIKVTIATGRMFSSVQRYAKELNLNIPLAVYNGALVKEALSGEEVGAWPVNIAVANKVTDFCRARNIYIHAYINDTLWVREDCEFARYYAAFAGVQFEVHGEELFQLPQAPHKLLVMTKDGRCEKVQKDLEDTFGHLIHVTSSQKNFLEIVDHNTSKWNAIKSMGEKWAIKPTEIMCIGDSNNDAEMVANAGLGVAMGNANDNIKSLAKVVTGSNDDDGVAMIINNMLTKQVNVPEDL
ncbi:MAG: Cof-type HAD-IIB family hydrolase, partial [Acidaminococcaceae bacterium]|nr:Cof-type HAD-IIB family hydrolase [Acidaminococcaceae bacterium]